jgi:hypothetical protein
MKFQSPSIVVLSLAASACPVFAQNADGVLDAEELSKLAAARKKAAE